MQCIIGSISINVVKFQRDRLPQPTLFSTSLALMHLEFLPQQAILKTPSILQLFMDHYVRKRTSTIAMRTASQNRLPQEMGCVKVHLSNTLFDGFVIATRRCQSNLCQHCTY